MKRDMDLCRKVLQCIEGLNTGVYTIDAGNLGDEFCGVEQDAVNHHVKILVGAGFIDATGGSVRGAPLVKGLTWEGHEFVEKSWDQGLWEKAKQTVKEKTGGLTVELLSAVLASLAKKAVGLGD